MYLGRFIVVAPNFGVYRVSSRSFPDRKIKKTENGLAVVPEEDYDNPYVAYNCLRQNKKGGTVLGNGSHVDTVKEKLDAGYPPRDALSVTLLAYDFEKDGYDTPRICGTIDRNNKSFIGIVTKNSLIVESVNEPTIVATNQKQKPEKMELNPENAENAAVLAYELDFEHPVASCAVFDGNISFYNGEN